MDEILARLWRNLYGRVDGPMNLRLIIQPTVATILAIRAGFRDARQDRPPFFWAVLWNPAIGANCCDRDGRTWERFLSSP